MSQVITNESKIQVQVASNLGWSEFCEWAGKLDDVKYFEVRHLAAQGWERDLDELMEQLQQALEEEPPSADVADVVQGIIDFLEENESEIVMVGNGMEPDEDDEDEDEDEDEDPDSDGDSGDDEPAGSVDGAEDRGVPAIHAGSVVDERLDAILTAMERSLGL